MQPCYYHGLQAAFAFTSCRRERRLAKQLMTDILCALSWRQYTVALQTIHVFNVNTTVRTARMKEFELRTPLLPSCPLLRCQSDLGFVIGPAIVLRARDLGASSSDNSDLSRHARSRRLESQNDGGPRHAQDHLRCIASHHIRTNLDLSTSTLPPQITAACHTQRSSPAGNRHSTHRQLS